MGHDTFRLGSRIPGESWNVFLSSEFHGRHMVRDGCFARSKPRSSPASCVSTERPVRPSGSRFSARHDPGSPRSQENHEHSFES